LTREGRSGLAAHGGVGGVSPGPGSLGHPPGSIREHFGVTDTLKFGPDFDYIYRTHGIRCAYILKG